MFRRLYQYLHRYKTNKKICYTSTLNEDIDKYISNSWYNMNNETILVFNAEINRYLNNVIWLQNGRNIEDLACSILKYISPEHYNETTLEQIEYILCLLPIQSKYRTDLTKLLLTIKERVELCEQY